MKADVLLGLQWGDEGKGKIVDVITPRYKVVARFQGGPNAGHTIEFNELKHVLHTIPSGVFRPGCLNVVGNGVVVDPVIFEKEVGELMDMNVDMNSTLLLSRKAHLILPTHRLLDEASEAEKGKGKIGSTLKGIAPTYMDKTGRNGLRVGDIFRKDFEERYQRLRDKHKHILTTQYNFDYELEAAESEWMKSIAFLRTLRTIDSEHFVNQKLDEGETLLCEGAQGSLLDIEFGSYPYVTSSNTVTAGACTGLGLAPSRIGEVMGIFKAYCTRVGSGPFPTELHDAMGEKLREQGGEFGATTGRPRRCGWLDLPALRYAIMINGVTQLIMTKADVLSGFEKIKVCTRYRWNGQLVDYLPYVVGDEDLEPIYEELPGWNTDICNIEGEADFPAQLTAYIHYLEDQLHVPITILSVGPGRRQTILRQRVTA